MDKHSSSIGGYCMMNKVKLSDRFGLHFQVVLAAFLLAMVIFLLNLPVVGPTIQADEGAYLANAAAIAGNLNDYTNQYYAGYSVLLSPAFLFGGEPSDIWVRVKLINALLYFATILSLFVFSGMLKPDIPLKDRFLSVLLVSLYPMWVCMVGYSFSENAFVPVFILVCIAFLSLFDGGKLEWVMSGLFTGFLFWIHPKSVPVIFAVLLSASYIAFFQRKFVDISLLLISLAFMLIFYKYLFEPWLHSRMVISDLVHSPAYPSVSILLAAFASKEQLVHTLSKFGGHLFYITIATAGLVWLAFQNMFRDVISSSIHLQDWRIKRCALLVFLGISFLGTLLLSVLFLSSSRALRLDHWMYGRYIEGILGPILLIAVLDFLKGKKGIFFSLFFSVMGVLLMSMGLVDYIHTAPFNVSAFWQEFFLRNSGIGAWFITGFLPIMVLYFSPKRVSLFLLMLLFLFNSALQIRWHIPASRGASQRWEVASFVRGHFPKGSAIGYDVNGLRNYIGKVFWFDFGFQLYDYALKRISLDAKHILPERAFFSFSRSETLLDEGFMPVMLSSHNGPVLWEKRDLNDFIESYPIRIRERMPLLAFYLKDGWYGLEKNHVWSNRKAEILMPIPQICRFNGGFIVLTASVFAASERREGCLLFSIDGEEYFAVSIEDDNVKNFKLPFKPERKVVKIKIAIPNAISPIELNSGSDRRTLGIALKAIDIEEYANTESRNLLVESNGTRISVAPLHNHYALGEAISFANNGLSEDFITFGWSGQEENYRWTDNSQASMLFHIQDRERGGDLLLRLRASAYLGGGLSHQSVEVFANEEKVATWEMADLDWYEAVIPSRLMQNDTLDIVFNISNPTSPSEVGQSGDTRKLGIAARELIIEKQK